MLLPRLNELNAGDYDLHVVKQTVTDYLPQMLTTYLEFPPAFATMHKMRNGKTSQAILIEQLTILNDKIEQIIVSVNRASRKTHSHGIIMINHPSMYYLP